MIKIIDKSKCCGCSACYNVCPKKAITMDSDNEGFLYPVINGDNCVDCGLCNKVCPVENKILPNSKQPIAYAGKINDETIRIESSSGGVFSAIATYVLNNGGVVFGAAFNDDFSVSHIAVETIDDLSRLRGSKYLQSSIDDTYTLAERFLKEGRLVLFSGTPCQVNGLISFLKKPYENLITQDLICHGVPSPDVWQKYVRYRSALAGASARRISSRHKKYGWKRFSVSFSFENDTEYLCQLNCDPFMRAFLNNMCLRPSCYDCSFKSLERNSDITLADFWGIEKVIPDFDDDKGTSLIMVHTEKGKQILEKVNGIILKSIDLNEAVKYNTSAYKSVKKPSKREAFLAQLTDENFEKKVNEFCRPSLKNRIKKIIKRILGRK